MARIFISHSSKDNLAAIAVKEWLIGLGYTEEDVFLDLHALGAGERWRDALRSANRRCEAVLLLASPAALVSEEVRREIVLAEEYHKPVLVGLLDGLDIDDHADPRLTPYRDRQLVDLAAEPRSATFMAAHQEQRRAVHFNAAGLAKIEARLRELGLEANSFPWTPPDLDSANPYPGLKGYSEAEAGLFFGRDPDIARGLAKLRELRATEDGRILVIQAASGAGKSSFLKAGLWPRLRRDGEFEPVAILRPAGGVISGPQGLAQGLTKWLAAANLDAEPPATLARALTGDIEVAGSYLATLIDRIAERAAAARRVAHEAAAAPSLIIGVDQAEELFAAADAEESRRLMILLARLAARTQGAKPIIVATLRADSVGALMRAAEDTILPPAEPFLLPPMPRERFSEVIQKPAQVASAAGLQLTLAPELVDRLIEDSAGADALPLLSVMLEQLVEDQRVGRKVDLALGPYVEAGGVGGALGKRLTQARSAAGARIKGAQGDAVLKRLFVPGLASWDLEASPPGAKRLIAVEAELIGEDPQLSALADALVEAHLLSRGAGEAGATLEVAHEALLRQPPVATWLEEDAEFLGWIGRLKKDRQAFDENRRGLLTGRELDIARAWLETRAADIPEAERAYVEASVADAARQAAQERSRSRKIVGWSVFAAIVMAVLAASAGWQFLEARKLATAEREAAEQAETEKGRAEAEKRRAEAAAKKAEVAATAAKKQRDRADEAAKTAADATKRAERELAQAQVTQSRFLASLSDQERVKHDAGSGVLLGLAGLPDAALGKEGARPLVLESTMSLKRSLSALREWTVLSGHASGVTSVAFSPDGTRILTSSYDKTARLWSVDGKLLQTLKGHSGYVLSVAFSPNGTRVLTRSDDETARLWDARTGKALKVFSGRKDLVRSIAFSSDGTRILAVLHDGTVQLWDAATGTAQAVLSGHTGDVNSVAFSPDGTRILTGSGDRTARLWDAMSGKVLVVLSGHSNDVSFVAFSPDGTRILTGSADATARLWDAKSGKQLMVLSGVTSSAKFIAFSPDGTRILTVLHGGTVRLWDAKSGKVLAVFSGHTVDVSSVAFSPDGRRILTGSGSSDLRAGDNTARLWSVDGEGKVKALAVFSGHSDDVTSVAFSPDGRRILTSSRDGTARLWLPEGEAFVVSSDPNDSVYPVAFSPDGARILTGSGTARLWDAASGKQLKVFSGNSSYVMSVAFSPDGARILTGSGDDMARLWDAASGKVLKEFSGHSADVTSVAFSPDGTRILTGSDDKTARLWSLDGKQLAVLSGHSEPVSSVAFSPDGSRILTGSSDNTARLWDAASGQELAVLSGHSEPVTSVAFSPDGTRILTGSYDKTARLWDVRGGKTIAVFSGHSRWVTSIAFSPDGHRILTGSSQGTRLWSLDGEMLAVFPGHEEYSWSVAFSPDGSQILAGSSDGAARLWDARTGQELVDHAKRRVPRCLTRGQRKKFFLPPEPPRWCITGPGLEAEKDPAKWKPKYPYQGEEWRDW
ncbi:MAG: TIR domain-containing protein, partial [Neomegalonema sp.]|nr:TIR domain-containing protein [Neomegalonema sp.]